MTVGRSWMAKMVALTALAVVAPPVAAQNAAAPDTSPAPTSNSVVGPRELQDFSLPGSVVRPAAPPNAASAPPVRARTRRTDSVAPRQDDSSVVTTRAAPRTIDPTERRLPTRTPAPSNVRDVSASPINETPPAVPAETPIPPPAAESTLSGVKSMWPWLLALLIGGGAAAFVYFRRQQAREPLAFAGPELSRAVPLAPLEPSPSMPQPSPLPPPIAGGIVARTLKPEMELVFTPLSVAIDEAGSATVVFDLVVHNSGGAPARDVLIEVGMFNAGPRQDAAIADFFANPLAQGDRIPMIAPVSQIAVRSRVSLASGQYEGVEVGGRKLLVPLVALNMFYRSAEGEAQRSASFLVGRGDNDAAKLAPFRLDRGAGAWGDVAARAHSSGLVANEMAS